MRRRRRRVRRKAAAVCLCTLAIPAAVSAAVKTVPHIAEAAEKLGSVTVGLENEPDKYTGEMGFNADFIADDNDCISEGLSLIHI